MNSPPQARKILRLQMLKYSKSSVFKGKIHSIWGVSDTPHIFILTQVHSNSSNSGECSRNTNKITAICKARIPQILGILFTWKDFVSVCTQFPNSMIFDKNCEIHILNLLLTFYYPNLPQFHEFGWKFDEFPWKFCAKVRNFQENDRKATHRQILENHWKINEIVWKSMNICENQWTISEHLWKSVEIQWGSVNISEN